MKAEEEGLSNQIKIMMGQSDTATFAGQEILTYKNNQETVYDFTGFENDFPVEAASCKVIDKKLADTNYPDLFAKYTNTETGTTRVLRIKLKLEGE